MSTRLHQLANDDFVKNIAGALESSIPKDLNYVLVIAHEDGGTMVVSNVVQEGQAHYLNEVLTAMGKSKTPQSEVMFQPH